MKWNFACLLFVVIFGLLACGPQKTDQGTSDLDGGENASDLKADALPVVYTIAVYTVPGEENERVAKQLKEKMADEHPSMPQFWVEPTQDGYVVNYGRYAQKDDAKPALGILQGLAKDKKLKTNMMIIVRVGDEDGHKDPMNLLSQKEKGYYSLQVAMYGGENRKKAMNQAKNKVNKLRKQGHDAYYYHGEYISYVTVGIFFYDHVALMTHDEVMSRSQGKQYHPTAGGVVHMFTKEIKQLREEFKFMMLNDEKLEVSMTEDQVKKYGKKYQYTHMVAIPGAERILSKDAPPEFREKLQRENKNQGSSGGSDVWVMP